MRRGIAVVVVAFFVHAAGASASYLCVPNINIPGCPAGASNEPTITDAVNNANVLGDTVLIGAGTYNESVDDQGKNLIFRGAGPTKTIIQGQGTPAFNVHSSRTTVQNLGINLHNEQGGTGLALAGIANNVAVTSNGLTMKNSIGVALTGGTFTHGSVSLPLNQQVDASGFAGVVGPGTLSDSTVSAVVGITDNETSTNSIPVVHRTRIQANQGVLVGTSPFSIDDSLIRTQVGAFSQIGIGFTDLVLFGSYTARHVDVIGTGAAGSTGLTAVSYGVTGPANTNVTLDSSILRGYATSISATANGQGVGPATTTVHVIRSYFDPSRESKTQLNNGTASIDQDSHSGNFDPKFVNAAAGDFHLSAGSPAIDAGSPLHKGESATDLYGVSRLIAGHKGDGKIPDIGASEFVPHSPTLKASAVALKLAAGKPDTFHATGSDPSPGDVVSFHWNFGDGHSANGASVKHTFVKQGHHHVVVTATDLDGFTATASMTVVALGPVLSKLSLKPASFHKGHGATINYRDSQAAKTTFKLLQAKGSKVLRTFTHKDKAGKNHVHLKGAGLKPGSYRLEAIPHNRAGKGKARFVKFKVLH